MSICNNVIQTPSTEELILESIKRDYGLANINNVNPGVDMCAEIFLGPTFTSNFTTLTSGLTISSTGVFILTEPTLDFSYTFTGNVSTLTAYTGNFEYQIFPRSGEEDLPTVDNISGTTTPVPTFSDILFYSASTSFSAITNSGFTYIETINNLNSDQEYVLNSNFLFNNNDCLIDREINTGNYLNEYVSGSSLYFVTVFKPEKPILGPFKSGGVKTPSTLTVDRRTVEGDTETYVFGVPQKDDTSINCQLITETLTINTLSPDTFILSYKPYDDSVMISVNGVTLSKYDYTITDHVIVTLTQNLNEGKDIITATYLACDKDLTSLNSEFYSITGITSGTTSAHTPTEKVYYNTDYNTYEYYTDLELEDQANLLLFLNGIKLTYGIDYYFSISSKNRIIFNVVTLTLGDIIHVIYTVNDTLEGDYDLITNGTILEWEVTTPTKVTERFNGNFLVEITESSDINFTSTATTQQIIVNYTDNQTRYYTSIPTTGITANNTYIWRVTNNKVYNGLLDNIFTTSTTSLVGKFYTNNTINSY
jgi:hypothetical protein